MKKGDKEWWPGMNYEEWEENEWEFEEYMKEGNKRSGVEKPPGDGGSFIIVVLVYAGIFFFSI